jgi:hypothetical protein
VSNQRADDTVGPSKFNLAETHLTKPQMAKAIGRGERTLDNWDRAHIGPPRIKFGSAVLYSIESFRQWLAAQEMAPGG